jgi:hypothetical protein
MHEDQGAAVQGQVGGQSSLSMYSASEGVWVFSRRGSTATLYVPGVKTAVQCK